MKGKLFRNLGKAALRLFLLAAILGVSMWVFRSYPILFYERPVFSANGESVPTLSFLHVVDGNLDTKNNLITIAAAFDYVSLANDQTGAAEIQMTKDIVALLRWGAGEVGDKGAVVIQLVTLSGNKIPAKEERVTPYYLLVTMMLNTSQIQKMLLKPPQSFTALQAMIASIQKGTNGTDASWIQPDTPTVYTGAQ